MSADVTPTLPDKFASGYEVLSSLHALLEAIAAKLRTHTLISTHGIRVLPEYSGDLFNTLNRVLNQKLSMLVQVGFESANANQKGQAVMMRDVRPVVHVYESVLFNQSAAGTKVSALAVAEAAIVQLHAWQPAKTDALPNPGGIYMQEDRTLFLNKEESQPQAGLICYTARFFTSSCLVCHCS